MARPRYGPTSTNPAALKLHKFTPRRSTDGDAIFVSRCGQTALHQHQLYRNGVPLDAIHRERCGNCFRGDDDG